MKRVLFTTTAGTGHFTPMITFAKELQSQGHTVKVAAPESFKDQVEKAGFEFLPFFDVDKDDPRVGAIFAQAPHIPFEEMQMLVGKVIFGLTNTEAALKKMPAIVEEYKPEIIISEMTEFSGPIMAQQNNIPFIRFGIGLAIGDQVLIKHCMEGIEPLLEQYTTTKDAFFEFLLKADYLTYFPESLEVPSYPAPIGRTIRLMHQSIESGATKKKQKNKERPLVYITFGTVASEIGFYPRIIQQIIDGIKEMPIDAVITIGNKADPKELKNIPKNFEVLQWKNQDEVLADADIVIAHVGSGTTLGSLAFGLPIIAIPLFADQFINAERLVAVNAAIKLEPNEELPKKTKEAVEIILSDKRNNKKIAEEMANQTSIKEAIKELNI